MFYLLLSILSSTLIFIVFKVSERFRARLTVLITLNYLAATILGFTLSDESHTINDIITKDWLPYAVVIGILFLIMFHVFGKSIQVAGMAVSTIAGKMSMVFPVLFSLLFFSEKLYLLKIIGLLTAFLAVGLTIYKPYKKLTNNLLYILPFLIFIGSGTTDSVVKYAQNFYVSNQEVLLFSSTVFLVSLILGLIFILARMVKSGFKITIHELWAGILLGLSNFGSLYFFVLALNNSGIESSIVFGLNSISIVLLSVIIGYLIFKEKLISINFAGIILAIISILILMKA